METIETQVCIIGSGPAAHTAAIYAARAELHPIAFEGWMANGIAAGGQLTTTTEVENFPGFPKGIGGYDLTEAFREQSVNAGAVIFTETVTHVDFSSHPFRVYTESHECVAQSVIVCTGAVARRLEFPGSGEGEGGYWMKGISACAVCDGAMPMFRRQHIAVVGGGDTAMEEADFLTKYGTKVYIIHRRDSLRASKVMQARATKNEKIEFVWNSHVVRAKGGEDGMLGAITVRNVNTGAERDLEVKGLFFGIGHDPATKFLGGQLALDEDAYVVTKPDSTATSVPGVFAAGDVQDKVWRQAVTAAGTGCMAALEVEHYLSDLADSKQEVAPAATAAVEAQLASL